MTHLTNEQIIEEMAKAVKAKLAETLNAKPLLGDTASGDWYTEPNSGSVNLTEMVEWFIQYLTSIGYQITKIEPTQDMVKAGKQFQGVDVYNDEVINIYKDMSKQGRIKS